MKCRINMSQIGSSELICFNVNVTKITPTLTENSLGRAEVLDFLLPQLNGRGLLNQDQYIEDIDDSMATDTGMLLNELKPFFERIYNTGEGEGEGEVAVGLTSNSQRIIVTELDTFPSNLSNVKASNFNASSFDSSSIKKLNRLLNNSKKSADLFSWLQPNYIGLVYSLEMLNFARLYATDQRSALAQYQHFEQPNNGLRCTLTYRAGSLTMSWRSPVQRFLVETSC